MLHALKTHMFVDLDCLTPNFPFEIFERDSADFGLRGLWWAGEWQNMELNTVTIGVLDCIICGHHGRSVPFFRRGQVCCCCCCVNIYILTMTWYCCRTRRPIFAHLQATPSKNPKLETTKKSITLDRKPDWAIGQQPCLAFSFSKLHVNGKQWHYTNGNIAWKCP